MLAQSSSVILIDIFFFFFNSKTGPCTSIYCRGSKNIADGGGG